MLTVHNESQHRKFRQRKPLSVSVEMCDWLEIQEIAAAKQVDISTLIRGWVLDRKTQVVMEQE